MHTRSILLKGFQQAQQMLKRYWLLYFNAKIRVYQMFAMF